MSAVFVLDLRSTRAPSSARWPKRRSRGARIKERAAKRVILLEAQGNRCAHCGEAFPRQWTDNDPESPTFDHIVPRSAGGIHSLSNLLLKHRRCNMERDDKPPNPRDRQWQEVVHRYLVEQSRRAA